MVFIKVLKFVREFLNSVYCNKSCKALINNYMKYVMKSKSNEDLINFFNLTDKSTISDLIQMMDTFFSLNMRKFKKLYHHLEEIPDSIR